MHLSTKSSLAEWLQYIEAIHPTEIELGLERLQKVTDRLLSKAKKPFVYTVAGTNGKGTTTAALSALSAAAGLQVGWYSSPHIQIFNERVQVNGVAVDDQSLVNAFALVEKARGDISLSYFEYTTLAAFVFFESKKLDVWVLEVGLGGRLDAVNVIDADVAVITSIALDHQDFLGSDLNGIGREKAGVARLNRPLVLGKDADNSGVLSVAKAKQAKVMVFGQDHGVRADSIYWQDGEISSKDVHIPNSNMACALQAFFLGPGSLSVEQVRKTAQNLIVKGRVQHLDYNGVSIVLDVGHNPHAARYIQSQLSDGHWHLIIGMLDNKDVSGFVEQLKPIAHSVNFVDLDCPRGRSAKALQSLCEPTESNCFSSVEKAIKTLNQQYPEDNLFIGGSFYTVQAAFEYMELTFGA